MISNTTVEVVQAANAILNAPTLAKYRKAIVWVLTAIVAIVPQVLTAFGDVIPDNVAALITSVATILGTILGILVPNAATDEQVNQVQTASAIVGPESPLVNPALTTALQNPTPPSIT